MQECKWQMRFICKVLIIPVESKQFLFSLFLFMLLGVSVASIVLTPGMEKIREHNLQFSREFLVKVSIPIAFIAGLISFVSPCVLPVLPMYFGTAFKQKKKLMKMTLVFFLGLSITFTLLGLIAASIGISIISLQYDYENLIVLIGVFMVILGLMELSGKGFSFLYGRFSPGVNSTVGAFVSGVVFGVGWTPCLGPILSGIILMASVLKNYVYAGILMFVYSLGIGVPLFVFAFFYDKYDLSKNRFIRGKEFNVKIGSRTVTLHSTQVLAGLLLMGVGIMFIVYKGTFIVNTIDPFNSKMFVFSQQRSLIGVK